MTDAVDQTKTNNRPSIGRESAMTVTPMHGDVRARTSVPIRPPRYLWVPIAFAVVAALGLLWGAAMFYVASH
jgi:hypothetical protein